jgi:heme/copper-type cytochrome/quinol oxidase subunit 1
MFPVGSIIQAASTDAGLMAASIAVGGFVLHVIPALSGAPDHRLRRATVTGGLWGLAVAFLIIVLSAFID